MPLRRGLMEHLKRGKMRPADVASYVIILMEADFKTGIWWSGSAAAVFFLSGQTMTERTARESMRRLENSGYIKRFTTPGKHGNYPVLVNRFRCEDGRILNAEDTKDYENPVYEVCREGVQEHVQEDVQGIASNREIRRKNIYIHTETLAFDSQELKITVRQDGSLGEAFPWVDRMSEYRKMASWLAANPSRRKTNFHRFAHNWFSRIPNSRLKIQEPGLDIPLAVPEFDPRLLNKS